MRLTNNIKLDTNMGGNSSVSLAYYSPSVIKESETKMKIVQTKKTTQIQGVQLSCAEDVINWLERLLDTHELSTAECMKADWSKEVTVYTDQVIKRRYSGMIKWLKETTDFQLTCLLNQGLGSLFTYIHIDVFTSPKGSATVYRLTL